MRLVSAAVLPVIFVTSGAGMHLNLDAFLKLPGLLNASLAVKRLWSAYFVDVVVNCPLIVVFQAIFEIVSVVTRLNHVLKVFHCGVLAVTRLMSFCVPLVGPCRSLSVAILLLCKFAYSASYP